MPKGGSIVQVQPNGCQKGQSKENKEGDIVAYLLPRAKVRLISKHKQIKTCNTERGSIRTITRTRLRIWGYTTHPTLGVLGLGNRACSERRAFNLQFLGSPCGANGYATVGHLLGHIL